MTAAPRYRVATREVAHEMIDGEVILIHSGRGTYHSLRGSAAAMFPVLVPGASAAELASALLATHEVDAERAARAAEAFLASLSEAGLVVEAPPGEGGNAAAAPPAPPSAAPGRARTPYEEPRIETFTDLQDLILADPIHEVEEAGWPNVAPETRRGAGA